MSRDWNDWVIFVVGLALTIAFGYFIFTSHVWNDEAHEGLDLYACQLVCENATFRGNNQAACESVDGGSELGTAYMHEQGWC